MMNIVEWTGDHFRGLVASAATLLGVIYWAFDWWNGDFWGGLSYLLGGFGLSAFFLLGLKGYQESIVALVIGGICSGAGSWSAIKATHVLDQGMLKARAELSDLGNSVQHRYGGVQLPGEKLFHLSMVCSTQTDTDANYLVFALSSVVEMRPELSVPMRLVNLTFDPPPDACREEYQELRRIDPEAFVVLETQNPLFAEGGYFRQNPQ